MLSLGALLTLLVLLPPALDATAPERPAPSKIANGGPRVRPHDTRSAKVLLDGIQRSAKIRAAVDELERHDVIAYVQMQPALNGRLVGTLTWLAATDSFRYVRISLNPEVTGAAAIAALGHELQHALEVARAPSIRDAASLMAFYQKNGISMPGHDNGWDTRAAREAGEEVRRELMATRHNRVAAVMQEFDPLSWHVVYHRAREQSR
jgi:hypothetical protein